MSKVSTLPEAKLYFYLVYIDARRGKSIRALLCNEIAMAVYARWAKFSLATLSVPTILL